MDLAAVVARFEAELDWSAVWARSGAGGLSGRRHGAPLAVPQALVRRMTAVAAMVAELTDRGGRRVDLDGPALLGERAALWGYSRQGDVSCGGATRLFRARDEWMALTLARPDDDVMLEAWLERSVPRSEAAEPWTTIVDAARQRPAADLIERAAVLGMACARLHEVRDDGSLVNVRRLGSWLRRQRLAELVVVDLSSLWAGPLCANVLGLAGARVIKVESVRRPDGARRGPPAFFDLMHGGHESVALDFADRADQKILRQLIGHADVVIEASRPRALTQLGVMPTRQGPRVWLSLTGYGRGEQAHRIAFGDDAAVAGGLVTADADGPCLCADAVADPATGLVAAAAVLDRLEARGRWMIDISLSRVAAWLTGGPLTGPMDDGVEAPRARQPDGVAPELGTHTRSVLREFNIR